MRLPKRPASATAQATTNRWAVTFAAEDIVRAEWMSLPENIRLVTEARGLLGDERRGLER